MVDKKKDEEAAIRWMEMAASNGHLHSMVCLGGEMYHTSGAKKEDEARWRSSGESHGVPRSYYT